MKIIKSRIFDLIFKKRIKSRKNIGKKFAIKKKINKKMFTFIKYEFKINLFHTKGNYKNICDKRKCEKLKYLQTLFCI